MRRIIAIFFILAFGVTAFAQSARKVRPRVVNTPVPQTQTTNDGEAPVLKNDNSTDDQAGPPVLVNPNARTTLPPPPPPLVEEVVDDEDIIKIDTNFVKLPVTVLDRNGRFVSGIRQNEFEVFDNGTKQDIEFFTSVSTPFTVVLLIDVSPSTRYKMDEIHRAAITFVNQLRHNDKVMVVAFDQKYRVLSQPTNNRSILRNAIYSTRFGNGTSLYDAMSSTISQQIKNIEGRKAIVVFTDGVDTTSRFSSAASTLRQVEELDAMVYPIRYNTISDGSIPQTTTQQRRQPNRRTIPQQTTTGSVLGDIMISIIASASKNANLPNFPRTGGQGSAEQYERGRRYLASMAVYSGGRMFEADTITNLDAAFRSIAEELRMQYALGYYPADTGEKGERRKINVRVRRGKLVVRTKRSYIVGSGS